ncbi:M16 family metallopeptidase [Asticcacaulis machinosus]|uniref:Pitrilysin family protein n=1 Tax=Asticcacaulis machinosus TaxID=2984211 RepID=A0ABT5HFB9_9CAUL|nr:pitrilysin family protein [Asticcacaulis machinosus]MDC7674953.1 pitrilysin family protein [Asticcacaulis machinosus]
MSETALAGSDIRLYRFENGLRLLVDPMPGLKTFALTAIVHGGTRFETETQSGWAHLLEHMVFKGAGGRSARELAEVIEHQGGTINASTSYEHTRFEVRGMSHLLPLALEVVTDLMFRPTMSPDELKREKLVVGQEISEAFDTPDDHVFDLLQSACFAGQSLGRPILGTVKSLKPVDAPTLRQFAHRLYAPQNMTMCVSGGIEPDSTYHALSAMLEGIEPVAALPEPLPGQFSREHKHLTRRIEQVNLALAFEGVDRFDDDLFATRLFCEILGGGMASRLFQSAREDRGLAYTIDAWSTQYRDTGVIGVYAGCLAADVEPLCELIAQNLRDLTHDPLERELERARAQFKTSLYLNEESPAMRAGAYAAQLLTYGRLFGIDEQARDLDAVTRDDLSRVGQLVLTQGGCASAILGPRLKIEPELALNQIFST